MQVLNLFIMFTVIAFMFVGIILGYAIKNIRLRFLNNSITILIWVLLFILGIEVGSNRQIINGLATLGLEAIIISMAAVLGSCVSAWALWYVLYKKRKGGKA